MITKQWVQALVFSKDTATPDNSTLSLHRPLPPLPRRPRPAHLLRPRLRPAEHQEGTDRDPAAAAVRRAKSRKMSGRKIRKTKEGDQARLPSLSSFSS